MAAIRGAAGLNEKGEGAKQKHDGQTDNKKLIDSAAS